MRKAVKGIFIALIIITILLTFLVFVAEIKPNWAYKACNYVHQEITNEALRPKDEFFVQFRSTMVIISGVFYVFIFAFSIATLATTRSEKEVKEEVIKEVKVKAEKAKKEHLEKKSKSLKERLSSIKGLIKVKKNDDGTTEITAEKVEIPEVSVDATENGTKITIKKEDKALNDSIDAFLNSIR